MMQWHKVASVALAVGLFATLSVSAQPGPRGNSGKGGSVEDIEAELAKVRDHMKSLEAKLASAKQKDEAKPGDKGRLGKGEKGKHDEKGRHGFGHRHGPRGPMHGFGPMRGHWGKGSFNHMRGHKGKGGYGHRRGPWDSMRGKEKGQKGEPAPKDSPELKGTVRSKEAPKTSGASNLEKKLDQLQKDLEEIRRELKRR
jgi:hypothetical protein